MAPAPAPWAVLGDALWCLGLGCLLAAARDALRLALGEGKLRCFLRDAAFFCRSGGAHLWLCGRTSAGGLARWYMSAAVLLGALCWHGRAARRTPGGVNAGGAAARPAARSHQNALQPLQDRAAQARTVRKSRKTAKKSQKTQNSAEKQLQKPSIILYN